MIILLFSHTLVAEQATRTLLNNERAPFVYVVLSPDRAVVPQSEGSVTRALQHGQNNLRVVAPEGMVPIGVEEGILVGYFAGPASGLSYRAVVVPLAAGEAPVTIDRSRIVRVGSTALQLSPWELPAWPEPVIVDGIAADWENERPAASFGGTDIPVRLELASLGQPLSMDESVFWRMGGTAVRRVYTIDGTDRWFVAIRTEGPILNNTGYHLRLVKESTPPQTVVEFSLLVDGRSGPVVFRPGVDSIGSVEPIRWVGQYALHDNFLELEIDRTVVRSLLRETGLPGNGAVTVDFSGSHRTPSRSERFILGSFPLPESLIAP